MANCKVCGGVKINSVCYFCRMERKAVKDADRRAGYRY